MIKQTSRKPLVVGIFVFIMVLTLTLVLTIMKYNLHSNREKNKIERASVTAKLLFEDYLDQSFSVTKTLNYIIETYGIPKKFDLLGADLLKSNKSIAAVQIVQNGTITHVYPYKGNEIVIGYNILEDSNRNLEAFKAINNKKLYFAGPFELKQGGMGIVGRLPIFNQDTFFGFSAVIIKFDSILKTAGIYPRLNSNYIFQISKINPNTGKEEFFVPNTDTSNFEYSLNLGENSEMGEWKLHVKKKEDTIFWIFVPIALLGILLALICGVFTWYITTQPQVLRKLVEERTNLLIKNEKMLNVTQHTAMVGSWEVNLIDQSFRSAETLKTILEVDKGYFFDLNSLIQFGADDANKTYIRHAFTEAMQKGTFFDFETKIKTFQGNEKWVRITGKCEMQDNIPTYIYGALQDIHLRKLAEEERKDIIQSIKDAFIAVDGDFLVSYWNHAAENIYGIKADQLLGKTLWDFADKMDIKQYKVEFKLAIQKQEVRFFECYSEKSKTWTDVSIYPKHNGLTIFIKNVTILHEHTIAIREQNKKLREIAWMQSHVIRAPLARMLGTLDLIAYKDENVDINDKHLKLIADSAHELDSIIKDISNKAEEITIESKD